MKKFVLNNWNLIMNNRYNPLRHLDMEHSVSSVFHFNFPISRRLACLPAHHRRHSYESYRLSAGTGIVNEESPCD